MKRLTLKTVFLSSVCYALLLVPADSAEGRQDVVLSIAGSDLSPAPLTRLSGEIVIDGIVNEAAWDLIEPLTMIAHGPIYGRAMTGAHGNSRDL